MIPFIQYMLPNGERRHREIERPEPIEKKAREILAAGLRFESEVLQTGHVSVTIFDPSVEEDAAIKIIPNGPQVPEAIDEMISEFSLDAWKMELRNRDQEEGDIE